MESSEVNEPMKTKNRGFWFSAFLILMLTANLVTGIAYLGNPDAITQLIPAMTNTIVTLMGIVAIINFVLAILIWNWKKIGIYGIYVSMALAFCMNIYIGLGFFGSLMGLIGGVIIYFATKNRWEHFS